MKLTENQLHLLDEIVDKSLDFMLLEMNDYQVFFKAKLKQHGVKSPFQIKDPEARKKFFEEIKGEWAKHPKNKKNM